MDAARQHLARLVHEAPQLFTSPLDPRRNQFDHGNDAVAGTVSDDDGLPDLIGWLFDVRGISLGDSAAVQRLSNFGDPCKMKIELLIVSDSRPIVHRHRSALQPVF
jgi:hypothetical protein